MLALALAFAVATQDTTARAPADTFADRGAAQVLANARGHQARAERLVTFYEADVTQRIGAGLRALGRDRMLFHQEMSAHVRWSRDSTSQIEMTGARQGIPIAQRGVQLPENLPREARDLAFDPGQTDIFLLGNDPEGMLSPLSPGAEADYRYASGDTTRITLPDGHEITIVELKVTPRRSSFHLMAGSLWFDAASWGMVRLVFRPARPFDFDLDADSSDRADVPGLIKPIRFDIQYVTLEYALYQSRWWLPRVMAFDGELTMGSFARMPARMERRWDILSVRGGAEPPPDYARRWRAGARRPEIKAPNDSVVALSGDSLDAIRKRCALEVDSARTARRARRDSTSGVEIDADPDMEFSGRRCVRRAIRVAKGLEPGPDVAVQVPRDTAALLAAPTLGPPILNIGDVISTRDIQDLGQAIGALPDLPWQMKPDIGLAQPRYNRVEALSLGIRGSMNLGVFAADASARIGIGDLAPNAEIEVIRRSRSVDWRLAAYRSLAVVDPPARSLGLGSSAEALLFGRDDGVYYRTAGVALTGAPGSAHASWAEWRVFAEHQSAASKTTDFSLAHVFNSANDFQPNITATTANQVGARLTVRGYHVYLAQLGLGGELMAEGQAGDIGYARAMATGRGTLPLGPATLGVEAAAGSSAGPVPPQGLWYLGGPETLRGYAGGVIAGPAFWRGRVELANAFPGFRLALFSDAGWAGARPAFGSGTPLHSVGFGLSLLDGLFRIDLAHALRAPRGWRLDVYAGGVL